MGTSAANTRRLIYALILSFCFIGVFTYFTVKDLHNKTIESNALLVAEVVVRQSKIVRNVYMREVVNKLKVDGSGAHPDYQMKPGYVPISAQFQRLLSEEAKDTLKDVEYKPISKWNIGPYGLDDDLFLHWAWAQLEKQNEKVKSKGIDWQPVWRIEKTSEGEILRYMDAIPATSMSCVNCHQKFEDMPQVKKIREQSGVEYHNSKLHHLMGAFAVDIHLDSIHDLSDTYLNKFIILIVIIMLLSFVIVLWFSTYSLQQLKSMMDITQQSQQDQLTGLLNRRIFNKSIEQHLNLIKTDQKAFSLCVFDLDGFKVVNDSHGHQAGDEMLREIAKVLQSTFRDNDVLFRLGGDEFSVILAGCHLDDALKLCTKLLNNIRAIKIDWEGSNLTVGASIGVYECNNGEMDKDDIFKRADSACYAAKAAGKDQVVSA